MKSLRSALAVAVLAAAPALAQQPAPETVIRLKSIAAGEHRPAAEKARDAWRHPVETLAFFGIRDDMTVVELWPGGGWYTRVVAPFLKDRGTLYLATREPGVANRNAANAQRDEVASKPEIYGRPIFTVLERGQYAIAPAGSADLILTFRNVHNWMEEGNAIDVFKAIFKALKPGGSLGLVDHRADPGAQDRNGRSGYVTEEHVIRLAEAAGFRLAATSEINANPKDTKDYPKGVWTLPPSYAMKEVGHEKYAAIGESDRMTLRFVKP